jgi:hypothetical protein
MEGWACYRQAGGLQRRFRVTAPACGQAPSAGARLPVRATCRTQIGTALHPIRCAPHGTQKPFHRTLSGPQAAVA